MSVFSYLDYREALRWHVESAKKLRSGLTYERVAEAMRVQKSYLSQVLNGRAELSPDQLYLFLKYFEVEGDEREYLTLLLEYSRSSLEDRRAELKKRIEEIQNAKLVSEAHLDVSQVETSAQGLSEYYLDSYNQLVHICLSKKQFRLNPQSLAHHLGISENRLQKVLLELERLKVIEAGKDEITVRKSHLHLSKEALVFASWRTQMRLMALDRLNRVGGEDCYNFSVIFSTTAKIREEIQQDFFNFIKQAQQKTKGSSPDQVLQMNFDFLRWI